MFSGIIADVGRITGVSVRDGGLRLQISVVNLDLSDVKLGDSIAVNGVCLTVVGCSTSNFLVDVSRESLRCTAGLEVEGNEVNLEKALRLADRLGGHLVSGHVDDVGEVLQFTNLKESWELIVLVQPLLVKFIAIKGSICINGVSLTVNQVRKNEFSVNLIPHTLAMTNLRNLREGSPVNLEVDMIARYCERMLSYQNNGLV